jgi:RNA polymerase sigma-70 factor, ECF subfamily
MADGAIEYPWTAPAETLAEDESLVVRAGHDPAAAGRLYDRYYDRIAGYLYRCTGDPVLTEDLTANVFLAAFQHLRRFRWRRIPFEAWLYRIATNEVRMHLRRRRRLRFWSLQSEDAGHQEAISRLQSPDPPAAEPCMAAESHHLLQKALIELEPKYRTVVVLRYYEGKSLSEISVITGQRQGTIKSQLHRALAQLQDRLTRLGVLRAEI